MTEESNKGTRIMSIIEKKNDDEAVSFSHVQLYVDRVEDLATYKALEDQLNAFSVAAAAAAALSRQTKVEEDESSLQLSLEQKRQLWRSVLTENNTETTTTTTDAATTAPSSFCPQNRDVVQQLLAGFGFRVTGARYDGSTRSVLVTSRDPAGVQILVTAAAAAATDEGEERASNNGDNAAKIFAASEYIRITLQSSVTTTPYMLYKQSLLPSICKQAR